MATLMKPGGDPIKDSAGNEIKDGSLVADALFGQGFARGIVACEKGGGFNVLIDWREKLGEDGIGRSRRVEDRGISRESLATRRRAASIQAQPTSLDRFTVTGESTMLKQPE